MEKQINENTTLAEEEHGRPELSCLLVFQRSLYTTWMEQQPICSLLKTQWILQLDSNAPSCCRPSILQGVS